jgi:hypothetical protein
MCDVVQIVERDTSNVEIAACRIREKINKNNNFILSFRSCYSKDSDPVCAIENRFVASYVHHESHFPSDFLDL